MMYAVVVAGLTALTLACLVLQHFTFSSLSKIRGPKSRSFLLGNLLELFQYSVGRTDFEWQSMYGNVVRFKTSFGVDQLWIADPKALQWILGSSAYHFPKELRVIAQMLGGKGIVWAKGEDHTRQRKILLPGFGGPECKAFLSIFKECAESLCAKWTDIIQNSGDKQVVFNVPQWLSRTTLDMIGQAAFDIQFGAIENNEHPLAKAYNNMMTDIFGRPSTQQIFVQAISKYIPEKILDWMVDHGSSSQFQRARKVNEVATAVAKELLREKAESLLAGKGKRDVFSLLVKANMDTQAKNKMTEEEMFSQMRTILFAAHDTTSCTLSWILMELARHPKMQTRLRAEIRATEATIRARANTQFTPADFDTMPYTIAVVKEGLRYHPVVPHTQRVVEKDDIIPLSRPITTETGEVLNEVVIPKGTRVVASVAAYNRNKELWGDDAHDFNPDRWLDGVANERKDVSVGVYSNLLTFLSGYRACLGWRFAVIEIQTLLVEMVGSFEFTLTEQSECVFRAPSIVMAPMIEGELERGCQLPLAVSIAPREEGS